MAKIRYQRRHSVDPEVARKLLRRVVERFARKYKFSARWEGADLALVSGRGVRGSVELRPGQILFEIKISLLLTPFKAKIRAEIIQQVEQALESVQQVEQALEGV